MKTVAQAMANCIQKTSYMLNGPPGVMEIGEHGIPRVRKDLTPEEYAAAREWACHDQTEETLAAYRDLGEAMAFEREKRIFEAVFGVPLTSI